MCFIECLPVVSISTVVMGSLTTQHCTTAATDVQQKNTFVMLLLGVTIFIINAYCISLTLQCCAKNCTQCAA